MKFSSEETPQNLSYFWKKMTRVSLAPFGKNMYFSFIRHTLVENEALRNLLIHICMFQQMLKNCAIKHVIK